MNLVIDRKQIVATSAAILLAFVACDSHAQETAATDRFGSDRVSKGIVALYDFNGQEEGWIRDRSGFGSPVDLRIGNRDAIRREAGKLIIRGNAKIVSNKPAQKISSAVVRSGEITVEAWLQPANTTQDGPARVLSLSSDSTHRNVTLGQDKTKWDVRLRSSSTSDNGIPSISTKERVANTELAHVACTRDRAGNVKIYVNGEQVTAGKTKGNLQNWNKTFRLTFGDEVSGGRQWRGTMHLVAIFNRALSVKEVEQNFAAGEEFKAAPVARRELAGPDHFALHVAPILADRCSECHDALSSDGGLDLTHKQAAFAGGDSGAAILPGKAQDSLLIQSILSDDMPHDRPPLLPAEKKILVDWVNSGAKWSLRYVDPVLFVHGSGSSERYVRRLTVNEYIATVRTTLGVDIEIEARAILPKDLRADGFANTAYNLNVDLKHIEAYGMLAEQVVAKLDMAAFVRRFTKKRKFTDNDVGAFIESMGQWILRGPISENEVIAYRGISTTLASSSGSFEEAAGLILQAMLQSPRFLYRLENQRGDGTAWPANEYELASRVSYILWGSSPDKELFEAAKDGDLFDPSKLEQQVDRMLRDRRATERGKQFVAQWLNLDSLANLNPNKERFPNWDPALAEDMRQETIAFFEHVALKHNRPMSEVLNAQITFATPSLAKHYKLQVKPSSKVASATSTPVRQTGQSLMIYDLTEDPARGGLLTQGSVLTIGGDEASMVTRGLFVLHDLLRGVVKDPPPCVDTTPVPSEPGLTQRMIATQRIKNEACGGCHARFEPLAFGLEKFDGLGAFHARDEHGNALREDGDILIPGTAKKIDYPSVSKLMDELEASPRVRESLTWKVTQFAMGRPLTVADAGSLDKIHKSAQAAGGSYRSLMKAIVLSDLVQLTWTERSEDVR
ncbi:MAG: DUF1592 domain-containing protein [Planctomycetota bacterium]